MTQRGSSLPTVGERPKVPEKLFGDGFSGTLSSVDTLGRKAPAGSRQHRATQ